MKNTRKSVDIALSTNDTYIKHIGPLIFAIAENNSDLDINLHIVYKNLTTEGLNQLVKLEQIFPDIHFDFRYIESDLVNQIATEHTDFPVETYFRLVLADVLHDVDRILYFDIDILVNGSIKDLWELDLKGSCIAGAIEKDNYMYFPEHAASLGLTPEHTYFNAGILLLDLKNMRERHLSETLLHLAIEKAEQLRFCDQDLLNMFFKDEVVLFDVKYNYSSWQMFNEPNEPSDVPIAHFNGSEKPWRMTSTYYGNQWKFVARYRHYQRAFDRLVHPERPLVSVLVDARQNDQFIQQCLESILSQSYGHLEIRVILDENNSKLIEQLTIYQTYEDRISYDFAHPQKEALLDSTYTKALTGDFVTYVTSTDFLTDYYVDTLLDLYHHYQADISIGDYYVLDTSKGVFLIRDTNQGDSRLLSKAEVIRNQTECHLTTSSGKLFTKTFLDSLTVTEEESALEINLLRRLYFESQAIAYRQRHIFCHRTALDLPLVIPNTVGDCVQKIAAVKKALVANHILNLDTISLHNYLATLLNTLKTLEQLDDANLTSDNRTDLALLALKEEQF